MKIPPPLPFPQELCARHPIPADLIYTPVSATYRWRCPRCGLGWVVEGSQMELLNDIAFAAQESLP